MMDLHLPPVYLIMVTYWLVPLKMLPVDMPVKLDIMLKEDLDGIVTDYLSNTKSIRN